MGENITITQNIPNGHKIWIPIGRKIDQMSKNLPTCSISKPSKFYPNGYFWFENIPSGKPDNILFQL
jgi:hypothetical protein